MYDVSRSLLYLSLRVNSLLKCPKMSICLWLVFIFVTWGNSLLEFSRRLTVVVSDFMAHDVSLENFH